MKRRAFMGAMAASAASLIVNPSWSALLAAGRTLPKRVLGKTGLELSVVGFSGIVVRENTREGADHVVGASVDLGVNYFDTAASYGNSETMLAPAIAHRRKDIILATKTRERTHEGAAEEFARSCELLQTDYFDMFLVHGIQDVEKDVDAAFAKGGAMEFLLEKKKEGRIRHLGFSSHSTESALRAMELYDFDFFYLPVNYIAWYKGDFGPAVLAKAEEKGIPCVALKAQARQRWPEDIPREQRCAKCWYQPIEDPEEASLALRWALSQPIASVLPPGDEALYRRTLALADNLDPITPEETSRLMAMAEDKVPLFPR